MFGFCHLQPKVPTNISGVENKYHTNDAKFYLWLWENENIPQCDYIFMIFSSNIIKFGKMILPYKFKANEWSEKVG